jgi:hypothetical protein
MLSNDAYQNGIRKTPTGETYVASDPDTAHLRPAGMTPVQLFFDAFDTGVLDVTNRWTITVSSGTVSGITQQIAVNLNGATLTGGTFDINIEWTEA